MEAGAAAATVPAVQQAPSLPPAVQQQPVQPLGPSLSHDYLAAAAAQQPGGQYGGGMRNVGSSPALLYGSTQGSSSQLDYLQGGMAAAASLQQLQQAQQAQQQAQAAAVGGFPDPATAQLLSAAGLGAAGLSAASLQGVADPLASMNRSFSEMSLDSTAAGLGSRFAPNSLSTGDLLAMTQGLHGEQCGGWSSWWCEEIPLPLLRQAHVHICTRAAQPNLPEENTHASTSAGPAGAGGLRGIASTGSIWPHHQHQASLGSSPVGAGVWPGGMVGHGSHGNLQDLLQKQALSAALQQQAAVNAALGLQGGLQQPNALVQNAALQAAVQQALLTQQAAALLGAGGLGGAGLLGPGGRRPPEAPLGGRLARRPMDPVAEAERRLQQVCRGWMAGV